MIVIRQDAVIGLGAQGHDKRMIYQNVIHNHVCVGMCPLFGNLFLRMTSPESVLFGHTVLHGNVRALAAAIQRQDLPVCSIVVSTHARLLDCKG